MRFSILAPFIAAAFYGPWAAFTNWGFDFGTVLSAGVVQAAFAFSSTWLLTRVVRWLMSRYDAAPKKSRVMLQCSSLLVAVPASLHFLAGTPHIFTAMFPGLVVGNLYSIYLINTFAAEESVTPLLSDMDV